ncbi:hypothetical protein CY34DRAFT_808121 [Suillus luteus UH-Slu-Lm8-n1]|uniref:MYND-type domain-containing protein n=1 Tax=Suillus luteus UH-Slu-Lm8-n1 TaxID=930992 RepID=A0A0D0AD22_9AGAM|nr:hypothetical protein CY34DRAFT_808121 [Suillus luteus UH-Slu-Lm8-n1]
MRESNHAFPAQNRACVCITSQCYDRRGLDTSSPLPLFTSLHHLTYLTSTSARIREIMTMDGAIERLMRILYDYCLCPPPPENPGYIYGLSPPNSRPPKLVPTINPGSYDKHAACRFGLALQSIVNIGIRGSEPIRSRIVQAGALEVVGCILESWLAHKGFAIGPSSSASGLPRESREHRLARRAALQEQRQREEATQLHRALQRQIAADAANRTEFITSRIDPIQDDETMADISNEPSYSNFSVRLGQTPAPGQVAARERPYYTRHSSSSSHEADTSAETSVNPTPQGSDTPTVTVLVNARERSGTIIARRAWDGPVIAPTTIRARTHRVRPTTASPDESTDNSRPETETEDDGDADVDMSQDTDDSAAPPVSAPRVRQPSRSMTLTQRPRRAVGIVSDAVPGPAPIQVNADAHIIIHHEQGGDGMAVGVEDGIVSLEPNDDFAMGAPPGAPGAMDETIPARGLRGVDVPLADRRVRTAPDATPRATAVPLPAAPVMPNAPHSEEPAREGAAANRGEHPTPTATMHTVRTSSHHHRDPDQGPFRDEDVLFSLQLLAYLSKYPHVRQAFYKQRPSFHPAASNISPRAQQQSVAGPSGTRNISAPPPSTPPAKEQYGFFRVLASATARGKEKEKAPLPTPVQLQRMTNVFSLVERFTFRPSMTENELPNPPPKLPPEIAYWAGVIMRNACRKDDSRGGIRQCANMLCGRWETYPREFAKCRRCRKAKYCGKECQSTAWSEGHRFWCSAKDGDETEEPTEHLHGADHGHGDGEGETPASVAASEAAQARAERRAERERQLRERERIGGTIPANHIVQQHMLHPPVNPPPVAAQLTVRPRGVVLPPTNQPQPVVPQVRRGSPSGTGFGAMHNRRRAETVSGVVDTSAIRETRMMIMQNVWQPLPRRRGGEVREDGGRGQEMWDLTPPGGEDMVLG